MAGSCVLSSAPDRDGVVPPGGDGLVPPGGDGVVPPSAPSGDGVVLAPAPGGDGVVLPPAPGEGLGEHSSLAAILLSATASTSMVLLRSRTTMALIWISPESVPDLMHWAVMETRPTLLRTRPL